MRLTIYMENFLLLHPLIARLSTETDAFVYFWLLCRQNVCFWIHSDVHFWYSSLSFSPLSASPSFVVTRRSLSFAHFCFSCRCLPSSRLLRLPFAVVGFLVISLFRHQPLIQLLLIAIVSCHSSTSACHSLCRFVVVLKVK